jgi:hypothetical protein
MNCNVIKDLLPLYIDQCCSEESKVLVRTHLKECNACRGECESMQKSLSPLPETQPDISLRPIHLWGASVLQAVMMFATFIMLAIGVVLEGNTPSGEGNGVWAVALIVPATGYLLSMVNWFFVRNYKNRKRFSNVSCLATVVFTGIGYLWAFLHYSEEMIWGYLPVYWGIALSLVLCILSKAVSEQYAVFLGRK